MHILDKKNDNPSNIGLIDPDEDSRWDSYIENNPESTVYHTSEWKKVLEKSFRHMSACYVGKTDLKRTHIISAIPAFLVRRGVLGNKLVSIPFASVFDPLVSTSEEMIDLVDFLISLSKKIKQILSKLELYLSLNLQIRIIFYVLVIINITFWIWIEK